MANQRIIDLPGVASMDGDTYFATDSANDGSLKINYPALAKAIIEQYNGSTLAGTAQTLQTAINGLKNRIITANFEFASLSYSSGTIGTRGTQVYQDLGFPRNYIILGISIISVNNSADFHPLAFYFDEKIYVNLYRASANAVTDGQVVVRVSLLVP